MNNIMEQDQSCNLRFLDSDVTITITDNIATVVVGYFIENEGSMPVTDVFNSATIRYSNDLVVDNITTNNVDIIITPSLGEIMYNGNLGTLVPEETVLVTLQFDIIGSGDTGEYIISNISNVVDGQGDDITFAKDVVLNVVEVTATVEYKQNRFEFTIDNDNTTRVVSKLRAAIVLPANVEVIFRSFGAFTATYLNTNEPIPINQVISGLNVIELVVDDVVLHPLSSVTLPVIFDLYSSKQIGKQYITASIEQLELRGDILFIPPLRRSEGTATAIAILDLKK